MVRSESKLDRSKSQLASLNISEIAELWKMILRYYLPLAIRNIHFTFYSTLLVIVTLITMGNKTTVSGTGIGVLSANSASRSCSICHRQTALGVISTWNDTGPINTIEHVGSVPKTIFVSKHWVNSSCGFFFVSHTG